MRCDSRFTPKIKLSAMVVFFIFTDKFQLFTAKMYYFINKYIKYYVSIKCRCIFVQELKNK